MYMHVRVDLLYLAIVVVEYSTNCSELDVATAAALCDEVYHGTSAEDELEGHTHTHSATHMSVEKYHLIELFSTQNTHTHLQMPNILIQ